MQAKCLYHCSTAFSLCTIGSKFDIPLHSEWNSAKAPEDFPGIFHSSSKTSHSLYSLWQSLIFSLGLPQSPIASWHSAPQAEHLIASPCKEEEPPAGMLSSYTSLINAILTDTAVQYANSTHATHMGVNNQSRGELLFPRLLSELPPHCEP